jgi:hypothetical protein
MKRIGFIGHQRPTKETVTKERLFKKVVEDGDAITYQNRSVLFNRLCPCIDVFDYVDDLASPYRRVRPGRSALRHRSLFGERIRHSRSMLSPRLPRHRADWNAPGRIWKVSETVPCQ